MYVLALEIELHLPQCRSLKEKRSVLRPIIDRLRHRHHLSVAEVGYQDKWQRAAIGVAVVASSATGAEELADLVDRLVWSSQGVEVLRIEREWMPT